VAAMNRKQFENILNNIERGFFYTLTSIRKDILFKHSKHLDVIDFKNVMFKSFNEKNKHNPTLKQIIKNIKS
jgi:hypothetical protein